MACAAGWPTVSGKPSKDKLVLKQARILVTEVHDEPDSRALGKFSAPPVRALKNAQQPSPSGISPMRDRDIPVQHDGCMLVALEAIGENPPSDVGPVSPTCPQMNCSI